MGLCGRRGKVSGSPKYRLTISAKLENVILGSNSRVGDRAQLKDSELGTGYEAKPGSTFCNSLMMVTDGPLGILKGERLAAGQDA